METAQERKERLRAMREAAAADPGEPEQPSEPPAAAEPVLKFRNYAMKDKNIEHTVIEAAHAPEFEEPVAEPPEATAGDVSP
jgi:hypothetical protein